MSDLFKPTQLGDLKLANKIVMAPMTRSRANSDGGANDLMRDYYAQRASAGLIISEGIYPCADGKGYARSPGIETDEQVHSWRRVTDAVHEKGGLIVAQIMHVGRAASHHNKPADARTFAPSAIAITGEVYTDAAGMAPFDTPIEMSVADIKRTIDQYVAGCENAIAAGFDGVELHFTSGYLPAQFLSSGSNQRQDDYGGSLENRLRFAIELIDAVSDAIGSARVGMRICPGNPFNDLQDDNPHETFSALLTSPACKELAYLHVIRMDAGVDNLALAKEYFSGPVIVNDSFDIASGTEIIQQGFAAVAYGRAFVANPDFVERSQKGIALSKINFKTLYTPGAEGYTDYPFADDKA